MDDRTSLAIRIRQLIFHMQLNLHTIQRIIIHYLNIISGIACLLVTVLLTIDFGFKLHENITALFIAFHTYLLVYFLVDFLVRILFEKRRLRYILIRPTDLLTLYPISSYFSFITISHSFFLSQVALLLIMFGRLAHINHFLNQLKLKPTQMFLFAFLLH